jgi:2-polyprenyl-3-methyl-5-hydroxy-6-metoxy-1,4-benzoquinol methylase
MTNFERHKHWEDIYKAKKQSEVGWYQPTPITSLEFVKQFNILLSAKIIDIGGGDSFFVDNLLYLGYKDITVLDISETAINRVRERLGVRGEKVKWINSDIVAFKPTEKYDFWHDRATFHFLTQNSEIKKYLDTAKRNIKPKGILVLGTFSEEGPKKCSGIEIKQYSETSLSDLLKPSFEKIKCTKINHKTPFDKLQNYIFCCFRKL